jgi:hypothetical protein
MSSAHAPTAGRHIRLPKTLAATPRRGLTLAAACALLVVLSCFLSWADVDWFLFGRSYPGTHFGEGRLTLALALLASALAAAAVFVPPLAYALPPLSASALGVVAWKYDDVATATNSLHGFHLTTVSVGGGLLLALVASALLLAASLHAVFDHIRIAGRSDGARLRKEERR